jgi:hypothetical protein
MEIKKIFITIFFIFFNITKIQSDSGQNSNIGALLFGASVATGITYAKFNKPKPNENHYNLQTVGQNSTTQVSQQSLDNINAKQPQSGETQQKNNPNKAPLLLISFDPNFNKYVATEELVERAIRHNSGNPQVTQYNQPRVILQNQPNSPINPSNVRNSTKQQNQAPLLLITYDPNFNKKDFFLNKFKELYRAHDIESLKAFLQNNGLQHLTDNRAETALNQGKNQQTLKENTSVAVRHTFNPLTKLPTKLIHLNVFHGTNSSSRGFGADSSRSHTQWLQMYAQYLAIKEEAMVYCDAIEWSGELSEGARKEAGMQIAQAILMEKQQIQEQNHTMPYSVHAIGHSYGTSVISVLADQLSKLNSPVSIDHAIYLGAPTLDVESQNIKQALNIFGASDLIGRGGSLLSTGLKSASLRKDADNTKNVVLKIEGRDTNHASVKDAFKYLIQITESSSQEFSPEERDLIINIKDTNAKPTEQTAQDEEDYNQARKGSNFQAIVMINENHSINGYTDEENEDIKKSRQREQEFLQEYGYSVRKKSPFYKNVVGEFISYGWFSRLF